MFYNSQRNSKEDSMGRKRLYGQLIGIRLMPETYIPQCVNTEQLNKGKILGTILLSIEGTTCAQLRKALVKTVDVPKEFCFLNAAGWPIDPSLDDKIFIVDCLLTKVVTIQAKNAKFYRIGIKLLNGPVLGFIYLNFHDKISAVRNLITSELADQFQKDENFMFVDSNLWPVQKKQESELSVWDLVVDNCISVSKKPMKRSSDIEPIQNVKKIKPSIIPIDVTNEDWSLDSNSILISYVHREATHYAKELKKALQTIGFTHIFLDIDNIPAGGDWQDVIASAVNNCSIFIPLVTHGYGETRWTNREAKLADDREKFIIPISFLDKWPPDQLAIQFLSLQYIPWKIHDDTNGGNFSCHSDAVWGKENVLRVANEIKMLCLNNETSTLDSVSLLDEIHVSASFDVNERSRKKVNHKENALIVISAHVKQQKFVEGKISKVLQNEGYDIWTSMNLCDCDEIACSPIEDSQPNTQTMEHSSSISNIGRAKSLKSIFKAKVKDAKLVVLVFSEDYIKSSICRQQAFYCEQRKKSIVIKYKAVRIDGPILNLYPEEEMITTDNVDFLKYRIHEKLKNTYEPSYWNYVNLMVTKLRTFIDTNRAVYIIGSDNKMSKNVEEFCRNLGNELAKVENFSVATGGSTGVSDIVGRNFCEEQEILHKGQTPKLFHIIAEDSLAVIASDDITFFTYGKTLQYGESESNRNDIVSTAFKVCLLISGGEKSACLAEKFLFNECIVIPVLHNSLSNVLKNSIEKVPDGVSENDWQRLKKPVIAEERAKLMRKIICQILKI